MQYKLGIQILNSIYRTSHTYKSIEVFQFTPRYQHVNLKELFMGVKTKYNVKILGEILSKYEFYSREHKPFLPALELDVIKYALQIFQKFCFLLLCPN